MRYKLLSAVSALAMAMAIGGAQAAEVLTADQLDTVWAGAAAAAAGTGTVAVAAATNSATVSALLFNVGGDVVNNDGPGAIAFTK